MTVCLFISFSADGGVPEDEYSALARLLRTVPRLVKALIHTPSPAKHPYVDEGPPLGLVLQLYFANLPDLEASLSRNVNLRVLNSRTEFPALASGDTTEQAMLVRSFDVAVPGFKSGSEAYCSYLVSYEGEADNPNAWHLHYLESHTRCIALLPGLRVLEVYTRLDWVSASSWRRVNYMQRNRVAFDNADALEAALSSPAREAIRADVLAFPAFTGPTRHVVMSTSLMKP